MKVLILNSVFGYGSTGRIVKCLYDILSENGDICCIAYSRGNTEEGYRTIKIGSTFDLYTHALLSRITDRQGFYSKCATKELIKEIEQFQPDIIHLHNLHGYFINIEILFTYLHSVNIPIVWTLHDCWPFTGHCAHYDYVNCDKWKVQCQSCVQKKSYPKSILIDNSHNNYLLKKKCFTLVNRMHIVVPSKWLQSQLNQSFLQAYDNSVIYNGIDLTSFYPRSSDLKSRYSLQNKIIILGVANVWSERKGLHYFLELSKHLTNKYQIILIGLSQKQLKQISGAKSNIIGITRTNSIEELAEFYTIADIFFNPTLEDNFPTTNLEALACGTPVFTFNTGGSPESIAPGCGKVLYSKEIQYIMEMFEKKAETSRKKCLEHSRNFNAKKAFSSYLELYRELL